MAQQLKNDSPSRGCTDVGKGDHVKVRGRWERITSNSAEGASHTPRNWTVTTEDGGSYSMFGIDRYAKAEDLE